MPLPDTRTGVLTLAAGAMLVLGAVPARADTMKQCSAKYHAAKQNGTLNGQDWKSFRAAQCTDSSAAAPAATMAATDAPATAAAPAPAITTPAIPPAPAAMARAAQASKPIAAASAGNAVFPSAVDPKYAKLTAGKARMKTCVDQYNANKTSNGNGGMKWIQKGGGYYSLCSKRLKGA